MKSPTAVTTSPGMVLAVAAELRPAVEFLPAGPMPADFSAEAARRTGSNVFHPTPHVIGEIFGGSRLDMSIEEAMSQARRWCPDLVLADAFDTIAPTIAAALGISWYQARVAPRPATSTRARRCSGKTLPGSSFRLANRSAED